MSGHQKPAVCAAFDGVNCSHARLRHHTLFWAILTGLALALASCGGEPRLTLPASPSPALVPAEQAAPTVAATPAAVKPAVGEVIWTTGIDPVTNAPSDAVARYLTDAPQLVAATRTTALPAGSSLEATWTYNNTPLEAFITRLSTDQTADERWLSFSLSRDPNAPWPAGLYEIGVALNGTPVQESSVEVVDAE